MSYHKFKADDGSEYGSFETFYAFKGDRINLDGEECEAGWYWWPCFPGCLPDGEANGPFSTEEEAISNALERNA